MIPDRVWDYCSDEWYKATLENRPKDKCLVSEKEFSTLAQEFGMLGERWIIFPTVLGVPIKVEDEV